MAGSYQIDDPVTRHVRKDYAVLIGDMTVQDALESIRAQGFGDRIIYFYVTDAEQRLVGVVPTRRLLITPLERPLREIMDARVITIPDTFTVFDACEYFIIHKLLAFPVVDAERRIIGIVDVGLFSNGMFDLNEREQMDALFESIGFRVSQVRDASPLKAFRVRFPWLLATVASGVLCALLVGAFQATLTASLILAFFLTLVLGLGESVCVQTMTITIHAVRYEAVSGAWYLRALAKEISVALLLGGSCATIVGATVYAWKRTLLPSLVIGGGIVCSLAVACVLGVTVPTLLHRLKLDLKVAGGPLTLALTDILTVFFYFGLATLVLR